MADKRTNTTFDILNLSKERQKFLFDPKYNPQFEYADEVPSSLLEKYATYMDADLLDLALEIMQRFLKEFGSEDAMRELEGEIISPLQVEKTIQAYLHQENLLDTVRIVQNSAFIARTSISTTPDEKVELKIRLPMEYRKNALPAILQHELGTHALRWVNEFQQPWYKRHTEYSMRDHLPTEEGLAVIHSALTHPSPYFWLAAVNYFASYHAQQDSFAEVAAKLKPYLPNLERRWSVTLRVKRGLEDTSEAGGYKKDQVYLSGITSLATWMRKNNFASQELYIGKVHHDEIEKMQEFSSITSYHYPTIINDPQYAKKVEKILKLNGITS